MSDQTSMLSDAERPAETPPAFAGPSTSAPTPKSWTVRQLHAVNSYCRNHNARPQLSTYPTVYFTNKTTGATERMEIKEVVDIYEVDQKEATRERARARRAEARRQS